MAETTVYDILKNEIYAGDFELSSEKSKIMKSQRLRQAHLLAVGRLPVARPRTSIPSISNRPGQRTLIRSETKSHTTGRSTSAFLLTAYGRLAIIRQDGRKSRHDRNEKVLYE